ncbi:CIC11C00000002361 [Sungouiella intermedia]|uniref:CIC11C00000002361 n=1 Tax=Sungouiella intermedia TaxID=45354 RepID=A0A1L0D5Q8_9ASCO|nr:CIC11C00000002361 [[Candida] intermedia]
MDGKDIAIRSLGSLSSLLDSQVTEMGAQIESITKSTKNLVPPSEYDALTKEQAITTPSDFDQSQLIAELYKARLELLMDIQKQEFFAEKIQAMINESEELVRSIIEYYDTAEQSRKMELKGSKQRFEKFKNDILGEKTNLLSLNSTHHEESYQKAARGAHEALVAIRDGYDELLSKKYKEDLGVLINRLNKSFQSKIN